MRVAFASSDGRVVDRHFGQAERFHVWEVGPATAGPVEVRVPDANAEGQENKTVGRTQILEGCTIVYAIQIGGPAAARLVAIRIHPMKTVVEAPVAALVERLQGVLRGTPPPWLRKAMGETPKRPSFEPDEDTI